MLAYGRDGLPAFVALVIASFPMGCLLEEEAELDPTEMESGVAEPATAAPIPVGELARSQIKIQCDQHEGAQLSPDSGDEETDVSAQCWDHCWDACAATKKGCKSVTVTPGLQCSYTCKSAPLGTDLPNEVELPTG